MAGELGWFTPEITEDARFNMERTMCETKGDICPTATWIRNNLEDHVRLNRNGLLYKEGAQNIFREDVPVKNNPFSNRTPRNRNSRNNNFEVQSQEDIERREKLIQTTKKEKQSSDTQVLKKTNKKKKCNTDDDGQRVFLGGLPIGITERKLRQQLAALGYKVLKRPKILHGFAPEVWMQTVDQAKDLVEKGKIMIQGLEVEVRPFNSWTKLSKLSKLPNVRKRSVFIGGMSQGTKTKDLQDALSEMGMKVINYPVIKHGFARQVILDTISQAKSLIKMKKIQVDGAFVDVRPFINQRCRRRTK